MNNSINVSNPSFGAKVNLSEIADQLKNKNPERIQKYVEKFSKDYPNDSFYMIKGGNDRVLMVLDDASSEFERIFSFPANEFKKLLRTSQKNIQETFAIACETLKGAIEYDAENSKTLAKAIKSGKIVEGSKGEEEFADKAEQQVRGFVKVLTEDDSVLSKAKFI